MDCGACCPPCCATWSFVSAILSAIFGLLIAGDNTTFQIKAQQQDEPWDLSQK
eukprot:gene1554-12652_t